MRIAFLLMIFIWLSSFAGFAQVKGKIIDENGNGLSAVNIYLEDGFLGTTSNDSGKYILDLKDLGNYTIVFQYLGYQTVRKNIEVEEFPYELNIELKVAKNSLEEVVIQSDENPANRIIRKAIEHRKENQQKIKAYTADFYSKGNWTVENMPDRILGQKVDEDGSFGLDSTGSGILYLSETKSKIKYESPDKFHEHILASKVSGDDSGFSLNSARDAEFSFYDNTISLSADLVSPIANFAFSYYRYKLISAHYDDKGHLINKIEVLPKRPADRVFSGLIYIVEDSWEIYGVELKTTGTSAQISVLNEINFNQSFKYAESEDFWVKISQDVNFTFKLFGVSGTGQFIGVYSNYDFHPGFDRDSFSREIMSYEKNANKKDSLFWEQTRAVPLTAAEMEDYIKKDSIAAVRETKAFQDSVDRKSNRFSFGDLMFGYTFKNSFKDYSISISSPLFGTHFNTVQGWNINVKTEFRKNNKEKRTFWKLYSKMSYGFADDRYRIAGGFEKKFNNFSRPHLTVEGGVTIEEINNTNSINLLINDVANIFFERNYLKLYDKQYAEVGYSQELFNGFRIQTKLGYERRRPLLNATDHVIRKDSNGGYTSNNPFVPEDFNSLPFKTHKIGKFRLMTSYNFGQEYYSYPDGKYNVRNYDFPELFLIYETGFVSDEKDYNFHQLQFNARQRLDFKNKGDFRYVLGAGKFFNAEEIALVDYKHFAGNQFRVNAGTQMNRYNLLPYYDFSTKDQYAEAHFEHNFQGWLLGKIPGVNKLGFKVVVGGHALWTGGKKPYQEVSIGLDNLGYGLFRVLKVDYVHSFYNGNDLGAVVFGLKFLP
ncbi:MAG TPA: DUF5686 and carboxypeptidase regulatory-like domain-containing protein [Flavobacteriaceae bacterium]|nr:DUF5686 and carboxypeptidase regulatory-like domain-containing protein [Flavobacteriaceae bacterium]